MMVLFFGLSISLNVAGQIFMKLGMNHKHVVSLGSLVFSAFSPLVLLGLACYGVSTLFWLKVLNSAPLGIAYPTLSLGYILLLILSSTFLKETIGTHQVLGSLIIVFGVWLIWTK